MEHEFGSYAVPRRDKEGRSRLVPLSSRVLGDYAREAIQGMPASTVFWTLASPRGLDENSSWRTYVESLIPPERSLVEESIANQVFFMGRLGDLTLAEVTSTRVNLAIVRPPQQHFLERALETEDDKRRRLAVEAKPRPTPIDIPAEELPRMVYELMQDLPASASMRDVQLGRLAEYEYFCAGIKKSSREQLTRAMWVLYVIDPNLTIAEASLDYSFEKVKRAGAKLKQFMRTIFQGEGLELDEIQD